MIARWAAGSATRRCAAAVAALGILTAVSAARAESLLDALKARDYERAAELVSQGADVNAAFPDGKTPLMVAGKDGLADLTAALIDAGADVNASNRNGGTPLMFSAITGDVATVGLLLAHGARVDAVGSMGWTVLMVAAVKGHADVIRMLLERGADPNRADVYGWTPLMRAASRNRRGAVGALLADPRTDRSLRDDDGATALHHAAEEGHREMVDYVVARGLDPGVRDARGRTAADRAVLAGHGPVAGREGSGPIVQ